jgi:signal peptidase I
MKPTQRNITILVIVIAVVLLVRLFLVGSYHITGNTLGNTLITGDYVLVNKLKSNKNNNRNQLILYKSPLQRDAERPPLFVGRCIGIPGDIIQMGVDGFRVNGRLLPNAPMMQPTFRISKNIKEPLLQTLESLRIPLRQMKEDSTGIILRMSQHEKELLIRNLSKVVPVDMINEHAFEYEFIIPCKGKTIILNEITLMVCKEAILKEAGSSAKIHDGKLFIHGKEKTSFTFLNNYFWIISENETEGIDSRHLGLIPQNHLIGNIWYCWYSKVAANRFKRIK